MTFTYSDDEWGRIAAELPNDAAWVRRVLEFQGENYIREVRAANGQPGRTYKLSRKAWKKIAKTARRLRDDIEVVGQHPLEIIYAFNRDDRDRLASFLIALPWFIERAEAMDGRLAVWDAESSKRSNNKHVQRDHYFDALLHEWEAQGRKRGRSTRSDGKPSGPLLRFMAAASTPVFKACGKPAATMGVLAGVARRHGE